MADLFASGLVIDAILVLVALEALALIGLHRFTGRGPQPADLLGNLLSGAMLMLALRTALVGGWWGWVAICLAGSLAAHMVDLSIRFSARETARAARAQAAPTTRPIPQP
jgi:hypothetical protein